MAAAMFAALVGDRAVVRSAGSAPASAVHPEVIEAMAEIGFDLGGMTPRQLDDADARAEVVVTMGCGDACPAVPGSRRIDWTLDDPAGRSRADLVRIRDEIADRVRALADELFG